MPGNLADFNVSESIGPDELRSDKTPNYRCSGAAITARINDYMSGIEVGWLFYHTARYGRAS